MRMPFDLDTYSERAEQFVTALDREYYLHFSGQKRSYEVEAVYERFDGLFERTNIEALRELVSNASGDQARRRLYLLRLAVDGLMGRETKRAAAQLAEREATAQIELDGKPVPYRQAPVLQANEPDSDRRAEIECLRLEVLDLKIFVLVLFVVEIV
jgi:hypothetical protein